VAGRGADPLVDDLAADAVADNVQWRKLRVRELRRLRQDRRDQVRVGGGEAGVERAHPIDPGRNRDLRGDLVEVWRRQRGSHPPVIAEYRHGA
jgi:hypothetical protein